MRPTLLVDLLVEGANAVAGRKIRSTLTGLGIALGMLALTAMIGLASSAGASISSEFDALKATRVEITGPSSVAEFNTNIGEEGVRRAASLNGVDAAGAVFSSGKQFSDVSLIQPVGDRKVPTSQIPLAAVDDGALKAEDTHVVYGRDFDHGHFLRADNVVLLGKLAAAQLGVSSDDNQILVFIDGNPLLVMGVVDTPDSASTLPMSVVLPISTAQRVGLAAGLSEISVVLRTRIGAAEQVGSEAPLALNATDPDSLQAAVPPHPARLEGAVERKTRIQLIALAIVSIVIGALGVSNTTLVGVLERRHEIGVRRAVGASASAIVLQFLIESAILGVSGGAAGTVLGLVVTLSVTALNDWVAVVVPAWLIGLGPGLGLGVGLIAGAHPAWRASHIEPVAAMT